jgi:GntR family transcriptional regulator, rspAB operon transcriptional repressor
MSPVQVAEGRNVGLIHDHLRSAILRGELAPGDELSQVRLARHLGVSRTPLREALRMLLSEGLVEGEPNRRLRVSAFSVADMEHLYVERVALEAVAVRITVPRQTPQDIGAMEGLFAQMAHFAAEQDYVCWEAPHRELHRAFVARAGRRIVRRLTQLSQHAERYRRAYTTRADRAWAAGLDEHRRIIDACKAHDADAAAAALIDHLGHTAIGVIELVEPSYDAAALRTAIEAAGSPVR